MKTILIRCNVDEHKAFNTIVKASLNTTCEDIVTAIFLHENLLDITIKLLKAKRLKNGTITFSLNYNNVMCLCLAYDYVIKGKHYFEYEQAVIESLLLLTIQGQAALN